MSVVDAESGARTADASRSGADAPRGGERPVILEARDIRRSYRMGDSVVHALDGVSFQVRQGDYWAIMGQSGSGKSTLLNLLGCLDRPTEGAYLLGGEDVAQLDDDDLAEIRGQRLGFIFQSFNLILQLTVLENIEVPLFYQGIPAREARERAQRYAEIVGLGGRTHHRPLELSGGQQQRVAIARALVNEPLVILADEATGNLDSATGREILTLLDQLHAQGRTIIMVTHDPSIANRAEWVLRLKDGKIDRIEPGGKHPEGIRAPEAH
jgi:putative ABC transport system ATP-binding protein